MNPNQKQQSAMSEQYESKPSVKTEWISVWEAMPKPHSKVICKYHGVYDRREVTYWEDGVNTHFGLINEPDGKGSQPATHWRYPEVQPSTQPAEVSGEWSKEAHSWSIEYHQGNRGYRVWGVPVSPCEETVVADFKGPNALRHAQSFVGIMQAGLFDPVKEIRELRERYTKLKKDFDIVCANERREAQLACDLRTSQDQVIERCAKAIQDRWPDAASALRRHEDGISGEDFGELKRENEALRTELAQAKAESLYHKGDCNCLKCVENRFNQFTQ